MSFMFYRLTVSRRRSSQYTLMVAPKVTTFDVKTAMEQLQHL